MLYWTAQVLVLAGRPGARMARTLLEAALRLDPAMDRARGWLRVIDASFARERGDLDHAISLLREANAILPNDDLIMANLGVSLAWAGRHEDGIQVLERSLRGARDISGEAEVWTALAWCYLRSGRAPKAIEVWERATQSRVQSPDLALLRDLAQVTRGQWVPRLDLAKALRARPSMLPLVLEFCQHLVSTRATEAAGTIVGALPERVQPWALQLMARSALNEQDEKAAQWLAREMERRFPDSARATLLRSEMALRNGQLEAALQHAREAEEREPAEAAVWEQMARVRVCRGEWRQATEAARQAVALRGSGALACGVAALELLEHQELRQAKRLFRAPRTGDGLACLYGFAAQALIRALEGEAEKALAVVLDGVEALEGLPKWASGQVCWEQAARALRRATEVAGGSLPEAAEETARRIEEAVARRAH